MRLIFKIVIAVTGAALLTLPLLLSSKRGEAVCGGVVITIADSSRHRFVTAEDIMSRLRSSGVAVTGAPVSEIPLGTLEKRVREFVELKKAEVYIAGDGMLHVWCRQREPVVRVVPSGGGLFFIDSEGVMMQRQTLYTPNIHVIEADMLFNAGSMNGVSIYEHAATANLAGVFELVNYIRRHSFWNGMIDQVNLARNGRVTLVPHVGTHLVSLGRVDNYEEKLHNLMVFYRQAMPVAGWDRYRMVSIEYNGQIVAQRR